MTARPLIPLLAILLAAAGPPADPDWPCVQRLVPVLTPGTLWAGHTGEADWRADPPVAAIVASVAPRNRPVGEAVAALNTFTATVAPAERPTVLDRVFAGLVEETNAQRSEVIARLHDVARRQRDLTKTVGAVTSQLRALPPDAPTPDRQEITTRRGFLIRDYEEVERTIRYACEVPVQLEARLGAFAQTLQAALDH